MTTVKIYAVMRGSEILDISTCERETREIAETCCGSMVELVPRESAPAHAEGAQPFAYCFTDVNGRPSELTGPPEHAAPEDKRVITALYKHPAPQVAVPEQRDDMIPEHFNVDECRGFRTGYNYLRDLLAAPTAPAGGPVVWPEPQDAMTAHLQDAARKAGYQPHEVDERLALFAGHFAGREDPVSDPDGLGEETDRIFKLRNVIKDARQRAEFAAQWNDDTEVRYQNSRIEAAEKSIAASPTAPAGEPDENDDMVIQADAYRYACEDMERWQSERAKAGKEIGTEGSLVDGMAWVHAYVERLERLLTEPRPDGACPHGVHGVHECGQCADDVPDHIARVSVERDIAAMKVRQQPVSDPDGLPGAPRPMSTAPRDGTMVRLLVQFTNHGVNDGFDSGPAWTIGANTYDDSGDDEWHIAGWDWQQDCFTAGEGEPLGWLPMLSAPAPDEREYARAAVLADRERAKAECEALQADYDRLARYYKNGIDCFANPCEKHSGERTPPFSEFFEKYGGQCLICVVDDSKALQAECEALKQQIEELEAAPDERDRAVAGEQADRCIGAINDMLDEREIAALALERHADNLIVMAERDGRNSDRESQQTWEEAAYFAKQEAKRLRAGKEGE